MLRKQICTFLILTSILCLTACGKQENPEKPITDETVTEQTDSTQTEPEATDVKEESANPSEIPLTLYYGNDDADTLLTKEITIHVDVLTNETIMAELAKLSVVPSDTKVLSFSSNSVDGKMQLNLDLSEEFGTYVSSMGTSGEYIIMGSVVNTFLKAYEADEIQITVAGNVLESGHQIYDYYLTQFPLTTKAE